MNVSSRPAVHPVENLPLSEAPPPMVAMKHVQGMPGTATGLFLRLCQFLLALVSLFVLVTAPGYQSVSAFGYLLGAVGLQCLWSLSLAIVDIYALLVKRSFLSYGIIHLFATGDGITSTLTFSGACASAGVTVFIGDDMRRCSLIHCEIFELAIASAFVCWFTVVPSFFVNFWSLASR